MTFVPRAVRALLISCLALTALGWTSNPAQAAPVADADAVMSMALPSSETPMTTIRRNLMMQTASSLVGKYQYTWGGGHGSTPGPTLGTCGSGYQGPTPCVDNKVKGFDCSGFTRYVLSEAGMGDFAMTANGFYKTTRAKTISASAALPGDLILFGSSGTAVHVAVYAGNGYMYEAASHSLDIVKSKVTRRSDLLAYRTVFV